MQGTELFTAYLVTFGWAVLGSISMAVGLLLMLLVFTKATPQIDEWKELKQGNVAVALVLAAVIIACAMVVSAMVRP